MTRTQTELLDRAGVVASAACAIHCLAMPLVIGILVAWGAAKVDSPVVEWVALAVSSIIGLLSLLPAYRNRHRRKCCLAFFLGGIVILFAARLLLNGLRTGETMAVCAGTALISTAHILNRRLCRSCRTCQLPANPPVDRQEKAGDEFSR